MKTHSSFFIAGKDKECYENTLQFFFIAGKDKECYENTLQFFL